MTNHERRAAELLQQLGGLPNESMRYPEAISRLAGIVESTFALASEAVWQEHGWHLVTMDRLVQQLAGTVRSFAGQAEQARRLEADSRAVRRLIVGLVELAGLLPTQLRLLGLRTSNWVELHEAIDESLEAFDWTLDVDEEARLRACELLALLTGEEHAALRQLYDRAFRNAGGLDCG